MKTVSYTKLYVMDGLAEKTTGAIVQYWWAIDESMNTRTYVITRDGVPESVQSYLLKIGYEDKIKKYSQVLESCGVPKCFRPHNPVSPSPIKQIECVDGPVYSTTELVPEEKMPTTITQPETTDPIKLDHPILTSLNFDDINALTSSRKISTLVGIINSIASAKHPYDQDACKLCKGDIFELFVEFLIKYQGRDPRIGITDYTIQKGKDVGVDGIGKSTKNSKPATVQCKYRQYNHVIKWNDDHISNFYNQSRLDYFDEIGFIPKDSANMLIITTAKEVHYTVAEFCKSQMRYICFDGLAQLVEGMEAFWDEFNRALAARKPQPSPDGPKPGKQLREHQREAVDKIMQAVSSDEPRLIIELPTGTGKTLIQAEAIRQCWTEKGFNCALIISPSILLTYQHLTEIADHLVTNGIDAEFLNISSGHFDDEQIRRWKEERGMEVDYIDSTTSVDTINTKYQNAKIKNKLLIISSTYHSAPKVWNAGTSNGWSPDIQMNDEAHFLTSEKSEKEGKAGYYLGIPGDPDKYCALNISKSSFSFSATPTLGNVGLDSAMRWVSGKDENGKRTYVANPLWGDVFRMAPKELIHRGEILRPVAHLVDTVDENGNSQRLEKRKSVIGSDDEDKSYYDELWRCIEQSYKYHSEYVKSQSANSDKLAAKLLVTLDTQETMINILGGELLKKGSEDGKTVPLRLIAGLMKTENGKNRRMGVPNFEKFFESKPDNMHVFAIASGTGAYVDGEWQGNAVDKGQFLRKLKEIPDDEGAIILYVDMLTEGIDVPGITGFMPMRNIGYSKFKQGMGRSSRLFKEDRIKFYKNEIGDALADASRYIKPHSAVIIPMALVSLVDSANDYLKIWREILQEYGAFYELVVSSSRISGTKEYNALDSIQEIAKLLKESEPGVRKIVQGIFDDPQKLFLDIDAITAVEFIDKMGVETAGKVFQKLNFDATLGKPVDSFTEPITALKLRTAINKSYDVDFNRMLKTTRNSGQGVFSNAIKSKFGTIYTPEFVVEKTIDLALKHLDDTLDRTNLKYCDPACGDGNFFSVLHRKLMEDKQFVARFPDPIERSRHIITKNIYGYEILRNMWMACRIRLTLLHLDVVKANSGNCSKHIDITDMLNITWGNTIKSPGDKGFDPDPKIGEGDFIQDLWVNEKRGNFDRWVWNPEVKFDVIIGNPPYTHLRNMDNRVYKAYPRQRDMAQLFVRWAMDHLSEIGMCSYNTINTWLNTKTSDGALMTREIIDQRIVEAITSDDIRTYSETQRGVGGGEIPTFIVCIGKTKRERTIRIGEDDYNYDAEMLMVPGFMQRLQGTKTQFEFKHCNIDKLFISTLNGLNTTRKHNSSSSDWRSFIYHEYAGTDFYIISKQGLYEHTYEGNWKLVKSSSIKADIMNDNRLSSAIKFANVTKDHGLWLVGYLNTQNAKKYVCSYCKLGANHGGWLAVLAAGTFTACQVPDFDWYKTNRPQQHADFLTWVEANMRDRDVFLAGIDEQFELLIK